MVLPEDDDDEELSCPVCAGFFLILGHAFRKKSTSIQQKSVNFCAKIMVCKQNEVKSMKNTVFYKRTVKVVFF